MREMEKLNGAMLRRISLVDKETKGASNVEEILNSVNTKEMKS